MWKKIAVLLLCVMFLPIWKISAKELSVTAPSVVLMEGSTGNVLYEKECHESRSIASITKVMTLLLTMEAIEDGKFGLDDMLTASAHAASMGGSDIWLKEGETMSVNDLLKATVIMSANDAAVVFAEAIAGSEESFVQMMNDKAKELGMNNTEFKNCNGLDADGHLSTAYDVALMSRELITHEKICDYTLTWIDYIRDGKTQLVNTNKLIRTYSGITGLKTGTTSTAGSCISVTATRDDMTLIAVVLGASTTDLRFEDATTLLNYGFAKWAIMYPEFSLPSEVEISNGMQDTISINVSDNSKILADIAQKGQISCKVEIDEELIAPIEIGQVVGKVKVMNGDECVKEIDIKSTEEVQKTSFLKVLWFLLSEFKL